MVCEQSIVWQFMVNLSFSRPVPHRVRACELFLPNIHPIVSPPKFDALVTMAYSYGSFINFRLIFGDHLQLHTSGMLLWADPFFDMILGKNQYSDKIHAFYYHPLR